MLSQDVTLLSWNAPTLDFGCGFVQDPAGRAYSAPQTPYLDLRGLTFKGRRGTGR